MISGTNGLFGDLDTTGRSQPSNYPGDENWNHMGSGCQCVSVKLEMGLHIEEMGIPHNGSCFCREMMRSRQMFWAHYFWHMFIQENGKMLPFAELEEGTR